jgi:hypothetical protein
MYKKNLIKNLQMMSQILNTALIEIYYFRKINMLHLQLDQIFKINYLKLEIKTKLLIIV